MWIKFNDLANQQNYFSLYDTSINHFVPYKTPNNYLRFWSNEFDNVQTPQQVEQGVWYHVANVYDGSNEYIYVNGQLAASSSVSPFSLSIYEQTAFIGSGWDGATPFNGVMDKVRVYNVALTAQEIQDIYTAS